jgi:hypothetical protein
MFDFIEHTLDQVAFLITLFKAMIFSIASQNSSIHGPVDRSSLCIEDLQMRRMIGLRSIFTNF